MDPATYSAEEGLRDGRRVEIRALKPDDQTDLLEAVGRMSEESRYFRFFAPKRFFTDSEVAYFTDVDFVDHVALVAILEEGERRQIVGGARYIVSRRGCAEVAFGVIDACQGLGIAGALMRHLFAIARTAGLNELEAEVLPENRRMLRVFERCGSPVVLTRAQGSVKVSIRLD